MIKVDLITGFLGSGKTTFIRKYASYLVEKGMKVGIIENDFGAINVDMVMLSDLDSEMCDVEQIVGGNVEADWKRRFKAKLIAMAMQGLKRVVVEPSGIYDVDAFFDVLYEEPVSNWYEPGNIFTIVDARVEDDLSKQARYLMASQIANAGAIIFSKAQEAAPEQIQESIKRLNGMLEEFHSNGTLTDEVITKPWNELTPEDYERLLNCGWHSADHEKLWFDHNDAFTSLFFMNVHMTAEVIKGTVEKLFADEKCGQILRVKGFFQQADGRWIEINATKDSFSMKTIEQAQEVVIVIGQGLVEEEIRIYFQKKRDSEGYDKQSGNHISRDT